MDQPTYAGYLFAYFTGEGSPDGEQVYFALSKGNDALHWQELNRGRPVLTSTLGEKGVRDPFIIRSPHGEKYYLLATDLKIYGNSDWGRAVTTGSRSIMIWESDDLVNWSEQRMVEVAPDEAGCAWAPEAYYDAESDAFVVYWASMLPATETNNTEDHYHKMLYAKTTDFVTFTPPQVLMDHGVSVIDTTVIEEKGTWYRFTKREHVIQESAISLFAPNFTCINDNLEKDVLRRGEGPIVFKSNTEEKWYLFIDEFGLRGYVPLETTDLNSGKWTLPNSYSLPPKSRHGSVIPVTEAEYDRLLRVFAA